MDAARAAQFWANVAVGSARDCWPWLAGKDTTRYGTFKVAGCRRPAHRLAYELLVGHIPEGLELDHLCRNRACVNPAHLEPVTHRENVLRGIGTAAANARKTHCKSGHLFTPENTYLSSSGKRECRICRRVRNNACMARYRERNHDAILARRRASYAKGRAAA